MASMYSFKECFSRTRNIHTGTSQKLEYSGKLQDPFCQLFAESEAVILHNHHRKVKRYIHTLVQFYSRSRHVYWGKLRSGGLLRPVKLFDPVR